MRTFFYMTFQGTVYSYLEERTRDALVLKKLSKILKGIPVEKAFDKLYSYVHLAPREWRQQFDVVDPFSSPEPRRSFVGTVWILDFDAGIMRYIKKHQNLCIPLNRFELHLVHLSDFQEYGPRPSNALVSREFQWVPCRSMRRLGLNQEQSWRRKALIYRLLSDFGFQWRHILCSRYNGLTFRKLASAIVRIATLDFVVQEETKERTYTFYEPIVSDFDIPDWESIQDPVVQVGTTMIIMAQHISHATEMLEGDLDLRRRYAGIQNLAPINAGSQTYLVISVKEMFLYRAIPQLPSGSKYPGPRRTEPVRLLDGVNPLSSKAVDLLLEATQNSNISTPMHKLPLELQDLILDNVSSGSIESARIGCLLNLGSPFAWRQDGRYVEREERNRARTTVTPVESRILFGNRPAGIAYK